MSSPCRACQRVNTASKSTFIIFFFPSTLPEDSVLFKESENDFRDAVLEKIMPATDWLRTVRSTCIPTWIFKWLSHKLQCAPLFSLDFFQMDGNYFVFSSGQLGDAIFFLNVQHNISYTNEHKLLSISHLKWKCSFYLLGILFVLGIHWYLWNQNVIWYQSI